jgi:hypothetical protein
MDSPMQVIFVQSFMIELLTARTNPVAEDNNITEFLGRLLILPHHKKLFYFQMSRYHKMGSPVVYSTLGGRKTERKYHCTGRVPTVRYGIYNTATRPRQAHDLSWNFWQTVDSHVSHHCWRALCWIYLLDVSNLWCRYNHANYWPWKGTDNGKHNLNFH